MTEEKIKETAAERLTKATKAAVRIGFNDAKIWKTSVDYALKTKLANGGPFDTEGAEDNEYAPPIARVEAESKLTSIISGILKEKDVDIVTIAFYYLESNEGEAVTFYDEETGEKLDPPRHEYF